MKQSLTLIVAMLFLLTGNTNAQVQRKVLLEHFTQASCGPCAAYNPSVQSIINSYSDRLVPIKYQVWWPGSDPMYNHNTADVQARVQYYPPSFGVPHSQLDGAWWGGHPANWTINTVNTRWAVSSPFEIDISHSIPATQDSVHVTMIIRAPQGFSGSAIAHIVVEEEHIHFANPPGTNGETDFHNVMKKMLPSNAGTPLSSSWAAGDSVVLTESWAMSNVYDVEEIAVVGFIQDPVTKYVHQAEYNPPLPPTPLFNYDVAMIELSGLPKATCSGSVDANVRIKNLGAFDLTSLDIKYQVNSGTVGTYSWTGNLAFYSEEDVTITGITFPVTANNELKIWAENPNGQADQNAINDTVSEDIVQAALATNTVTMTLRTDNGPGETTWELTDASGNVLYSGGPYSQSQTFFNETFTLNNAGCYTFSIYDAGGDGICCSNGTGFYRLTDANNNNFITGSNFEDEDVSEFSVLAVGLEEGLSAVTGLMIYPNPASAGASIIFNKSNYGNVDISLYDLPGNKVRTIYSGELSAGGHELNLQLADLANGMYILQLHSEGETITQKVNVIK